MVRSFDTHDAAVGRIELWGALGLGHPACWVRIGLVTEYYCRDKTPAGVCLYLSAGDTISVESWRVREMEEG